MNRVHKQKDDLERQIDKLRRGRKMFEAERLAYMKSFEIEDVD